MGRPGGAFAIKRDEPMLILTRAIMLEWLVALVIAFSVTSVWRGAWVILDALFLPQRPLLSALASLLAGSVGLVIACFVQPSLAAWARAHDHWRTLWVADASYSYLSAWVCVFYWRGSWALWDQLFSVGLPPASADAGRAFTGVASHVAGLLVLLMLGAVRNLVAAPMLISSDASAPIFGAGATAGLAGLNPLERLKHPPTVHSEAEWSSLVGLPDSHGGSTEVARVAEARGAERRRRNELDHEPAAAAA